MLNEMLIGTIILLIAILTFVFYPVLITLVLGLVCFMMIAYLIGVTIRECMPGYKGL